MSLVSLDASLDVSLNACAALLYERRAVVLSGAGISTESGIPDYRGPKSLERPRNPILYKQFVGSEAVRRRYWARGFAGWATVRQATPNQGHRALAQLEACGILTGIITQNVDGLHHKAGSQNVLELHGRLARVRCLRCHALEDRAQVQRRMCEHNPTFATRWVEVAPDGDAEIPQTLVDRFQVPSCLHCGGILKPDVVFFGENVCQTHVARAWAMLQDAELLLVVGSSLTVRSGYRFVVRAVAEDKPVIIINDGPTRGDQEASLRLGGRLGDVLPRLVTLLGERPLAGGGYPPLPPLKIP